MVGSIWLQFDHQHITNEKDLNLIKTTIKDKYKCYAYFSTDYTHTMEFRLLSIRQIKNIIKKLNLNIDDNKRCTCGCLSTDFERVMHFTELEFNYGKIHKLLNKYIYFRLGRNITLSVKPYDERFKIIRYILEDLKKEYDKLGIKCELDISDTGSVFQDKP